MHSKTSKKIIILALAAVMALGIFATTATAAPLVAKPTASTVLVNGKNVAFDAYNINDNNYFKLRDLAYTLNGTAKQFAVSWDGANNAISLTSGQTYTPDGSEMKSKGAGNKTPTPTTSKITLDGKDVQFTAYNIEGNNYFKLRDIGQAFDFGVDWDAAAQTIRIDTSKVYTPETATPTPTPQPSGSTNKDFVGNWDGMIGPNCEYYIELCADGSCTQLMVHLAARSGAYRYKLCVVRTGRWSYSEGTLFFTQQKRAEWYGLWYDPSECNVELVWEATGDSSLRISEMHEPSCGYEHSAERHFLLLDIPGTMIAHDYYDDITVILNRGGTVMAERSRMPNFVYPWIVD